MDVFAQQKTPVNTPINITIKIIKTNLRLTKKNLFNPSER